MHRATPAILSSIHPQLFPGGGACSERPAVSDARACRRSALHARHGAGPARRRACYSPNGRLLAAPGLHRALPPRLHGAMHEHALYEQRDAGALRGTCARRQGRRAVPARAAWDYEGVVVRTQRWWADDELLRGRRRERHRLLQGAKQARAVHRRTSRTSTRRRDRLRGRAPGQPCQRAARAQPVGDRRDESTVAAE